MRNEHGGDVYRHRVKLDFSVNINPFGMPAGVEKALHEAVSYCTRYPDCFSEELRDALGSKLGLMPWQLVMGNGASELFWAVIHAVKPKQVLIPVPSFLGYQKAAACEGCSVQFAFMKKEDGFALKEDFLTQLTPETDLVFLANPNNPTGKCIDKELLRTIAEQCCRNKIWLVVDECFLDFTGKEKETMLRLLPDNPNLIVVRAFTKLYGIPGVRLGYLASANGELIGRLEKQLPEWNLSLLAQYAGAAALKEDAYISRTVSYTAAQRGYLSEELRRLGFTVYDSEANYILFHTSQNLYQDLLRQGILIRDCSNYIGLGSGYFRIAVKTEEENRMLVEALKKEMCR